MRTNNSPEPATCIAALVHELYGPTYKEIATVEGRDH
jgi:hypothetical protein